MDFKRDNGSYKTEFDEKEPLTGRQLLLEAFTGVTQGS